MTLSPGRVRFALFALALGGFGIGATEFVAMGLLPQIASDLLPRMWETKPDQALAQTGAMISAYAAGVVVGAPTIAALAARFQRRRLLLALAAAFTVGTVASALAPSFGLVIAARFVAGLPHGAYFGIAALVASSLMGPGRRGRGIAFVLSGLTIASVIGVPLITLLGQSAGWRIAYLVVAAIFAATLVAIWFAVPMQPGDPAATFRRELRAFRRIRVWFALLTGAVGFGGFFAVYSYIAPMVTEVARLSSTTVPLALMTIGIGMTIGNLVGGRLADHGAVRAIFFCFAAFAVALVILALTVSHPVGLFAGLLLVGGTGSAMSAPIQTRLMDVAGESQTLAAALNHSALNIGNSLGAFLGGVVIASGYGFVAPIWIGVLLCVPGAMFAVGGYLASRNHPHTASIRTAPPTG
ncbi:MAG TPA: MFS transporter [Pseudolysinimonas sp.]|nr:MFS transporter [Pseudolysinimonas sp.]